MYTCTLLRLWDPEILKSLKSLKSSREAFEGLHRLLPEQPRSCPGSFERTPSVLWACLRASTICSRVYTTSYTLWNNLDERTWRANSAPEKIFDCGSAESIFRPDS